MQALTPRQRQIMDFFVEGYTSEEAARELHISAKTVRTQRASILRRLHARNIAQAVAIYIRDRNEVNA